MRAQADHPFVRASRLKELGYRDYRSYLKSPHWRGLRERYLTSGLPAVCICGEERVQLHHKTYARIGAERLEDLVALCGSCHAMVHVLERRGDMDPALTGFEDSDRATAGQELLARIAARSAQESELAQAEVKGWLETLPFDQRVRLALRMGVERRHSASMSSPKRLLKKCIVAGDRERALRALRRLEETAYGWRTRAPRSDEEVALREAPVLWAAAQ